MPFFTRPNFEDRQIVQRNGDTITLSGETNIDTSGQLIIKGVTLDFTGTTTASTLYTVAGVSGYINQGNVSGLKIEPPILLISGSTGTTTVDVTGYYLGGLDQYGSVVWVPPFTGTTSGKCLTELCIDGNVLIKEILSLLKDMYVNDIRFGRGEGDWVSNTTVGKDSLSANTIGLELTAMGYESLKSNTIGDRNTAFGYRTLNLNTTGSDNISIGVDSLLNNDSGFDNIAIGSNALFNNDSAYNVAIGKDSLFSNTNGLDNIGIGSDSLTTNTTGSDNIGIGYGSLSDNSIGTNNIAIGTNSLRYNAIGGENISIGFNSLLLNINGVANTAVGSYSLGLNTVGDYNVSIGQSSLQNNSVGNNNVAIGYGSGSGNISGNSNTFIGDSAYCVGTLNNATAIGANSFVSQSDSLILGDGVADVGINTPAPTSKLHVIGTNGYNQFRMETSFSPTGTTDFRGNIGDMAWDDNNIYIKTSVGWKQSTLNTF